MVKLCNRWASHHDVLGVPSQAGVPPAEQPLRRPAAEKPSNGGSRKARRGHSRMLYQQALPHPAKTRTVVDGGEINQRVVDVRSEVASGFARVEVTMRLICTPLVALACLNGLKGIGSAKSKG